MRTARWLKIGLVILGAMLLLACNPFGDDDEDRPDQVQVVEVGNQISSESSNRSNQFNQAPPTNAQEETAPTEGSGDLESQRESSSVEPPAAGVAVNFAPEEARDLVWAYLSQCIALTASELEAHEIRGEWFVQATGDAPDKYGLWKVDPATGTVQPHNVRAREWDPLVNPECTRELFKGFFTPTPSPCLILR